MREDQLDNLMSQQNTMLYKCNIVSDIELLHKARIHKENIENLTFILSKQYKEEIKRVKELTVKIEKKQCEVEKIVQVQQDGLKYKGYWNIIQEDDFWESIEKNLNAYKPFFTLCREMIPSSRKFKVLEETLSLETLRGYKDLIDCSKREITQLECVIKNKNIKKQELLFEYKALEKTFLKISSELEDCLGGNALKNELRSIEKQLQEVEQEIINDNMLEQTQVVERKKVYKKNLAQLNKSLMTIYTQHNELVMELSNIVIVKRQRLNSELYSLFKNQQYILKQLRYHKEQSEKYVNRGDNSNPHIVLSLLEEKLNYHKLKLEEVQASFKTSKSRLVIGKSIESLDQVLNELYREKAIL